MDDDIDMGASGNIQRPPPKGPYRGRGGRPYSSKSIQGIKKTFIPGSLPWYQIIIPYGAKHEKEVVLKALQSYLSPDGFIPHYYKITGNSAMFYVDDVEMAAKLFHADRKITMSDGYRLVVIVRNSVPIVNIDENMKQKMKLVIAKRYIATTKALDLTKFHADPGK